MRREYYGYGLTKTTTAETELSRSLCGGHQDATDLVCSSLFTCFLSSSLFSFLLQHCCYLRRELSLSCMLLCWATEGVGSVCTAPSGCYWEVPVPEILRSIVFLLSLSQKFQTSITSIFIPQIDAVWPAQHSVAARRKYEGRTHISDLEKRFYWRLNLQMNLNSCFLRLLLR
jgi:hypothetical protein